MEITTFAGSSMTLDEDEVRVRVEHEFDPDFSYLSDEEEYAENPQYGGFLFHSERPEMQRYNGMWFDATHVTSGKFKVGTYHLVKFENGDVRLATQEEARMPWEVYQDTWGDANNYISVVLVLERWKPECECCGRSGDWEEVDSIGGCDFYDGYTRQRYSVPCVGTTYSISELRNDIARYGDRSWVHVTDYNFSLGLTS